MQTVSAAFTAEEKDSVRQISHNLQVSWKRFSLLSSRTFTIGTSLIGGNDVIGANPGAIGSPGNYQYFDETNYVMSMAWERGYNMPTGGMSKAMAEFVLDNTSGRFLPRYMGGSSELFTSVQYPSRPVIINAGFEVGGVDNVIPQFSGVTNQAPAIDVRSKTINLQAEDYANYFQGKYLDRAAIWTSEATDVVMKDLLMQQAGMSTAQFDLDMGINVIPFGYIPPGSKFSDVLHQLAESENGHFYQDESGIWKFENRYNWAASDPIDKLILTGQVINAEAPNTDHLVNVVEVQSKAFAKQPEQIIFRLNPFDAVALAPSTTTELFVDFDDPALSMTTPTATGQNSYYQVFVNSDGTGNDLSSSVSVSHVDRFVNSAKLQFSNSSTRTLYLTNLVITGRVARSVSDIYTRAQDSSSLTAYQEHAILIDNPFIQSQVWAESYAQMLLEDYSSPENLQRITIRAIPELQLGDYISWQGRYWRVFDIKATLNPAEGFTQELLILQRSQAQYFRIGVSTIAGSDKIAP